MFQDLARRGVGKTVDADVVAEIWERSGGHTGLINLFGKWMNDVLVPQCQHITLPVRLCFVHDDIISWGDNCPAMSRQVKDLTIKGSLEDGNVAARRLLRVLAATDMLVTVSEDLHFI